MMFAPATHTVPRYRRRELFSHEFAPTQTHTTQDATPRKHHRTPGPPSFHTFQEINEESKHSGSTKPERSLHPHLHLPSPTIKQQQDQFQHTQHSTLEHSPAYINIPFPLHQIPKKTTNNILLAAQRCPARQSRGRPRTSWSPPVVESHGPPHVVESAQSRPPSTACPSGPPLVIKNPSLHRKLQRRILDDQFPRGGRNAAGETRCRCPLKK